MNFSLGAEMYAKECAILITDDDVAVERSEHSAGRRGVAGTLVVEKVLGAAAERGHRLDALTRLGKRVKEMTRSMGVALTSCTVPASTRPTFCLGPNHMQIVFG